MSKSNFFLLTNMTFRETRISPSSRYSGTLLERLPLELQRKLSLFTPCSFSVKVSRHRTRRDAMITLRGNLYETSFVLSDINSNSLFESIQKGHRNEVPISYRMGHSNIPGKLSYDPTVQEFILRDCPVSLPVDKDLLSLLTDVSRRYFETGIFSESLTHSLYTLTFDVTLTSRPEISNFRLHLPSAVLNIKKLDQLLELVFSLRENPDLSWPEDPLEYSMSSFRYDASQGRIYLVGDLYLPVCQELLHAGIWTHH